MITGDIPTEKGGGEKANYFLIIGHLLSSFIIGYHHRKCGFDFRDAARWGEVGLYLLQFFNPASSFGSAHHYLFA